MTEQPNQPPEGALQIVETAPLVDVGALSRDEIDIQVATAQRYPRSIVACQRTVVELATLNQDTAIACSYGFKRGGKMITGPSIHFAKVLAFAWKNIRVQGRIVGATDTEVFAEAVCWDLERNVAWASPSHRKILDRNGKRYSDDMITVTGMAAVSIAQRNAVFKTVPEPLWRAAYQKVQDTARGSAETLDARRKKWLQWFEKQGIRPDQLLKLVGAPGFADVTLDHIVEMQAISQAIVDKEVTVLELLAEVQAKPEDGDKPSSLQAAIDKRKEKTDDGKVPTDADAGRGQADPPANGPAQTSQPAEDPSPGQAAGQ
jgi:hypothetical protein